MNVKCSSPVIIRHKLLRERLQRCSSCSFCGSVYILDPITKYKLLHDDRYFIQYFSTNKFDLSKELDDYFIIDHVSGECYPIYQVLSCGKCIVCKDRKTRQWMTRAFAENVTSDTPPLFVTLTYNDHSIRPCGLLKEDCQNFMKRLRKRLSDDGYMCDLRFYLAGEYGKHTFRPHYHLLLWNFPYMNYRVLCDYLQDAWSVIISKEEYQDIRNSDIVYTEEIIKWNIGIHQWQPTILYRKRLGFVYPLYVTKGASSYCMKYMRKDPIVPLGKVAPFQLCSRRSGLGSKWIDSQKDFYHSNPDVLDVELYDKWTNESYKSVLPLYFTNRLFPSRSSLLSKDLRDTFNDWSKIGNTIIAIRKYFKMDPFSLCQDILDKFSMLVPSPYKKFKDLLPDLLSDHQSFIAKDLDLNFYDLPLDRLKSCSAYSHKIVAEDTYFPIYFSHWDRDPGSSTFGSTKLVSYNDRISPWLCRLYYDLIREYEFLSTFLRSYDLDLEYYNTITSKKLLHQFYVSESVKNSDPIDVIEYSEYLYRRIVDAERKEIF